MAKPWEPGKQKLPGKYIWKHKRDEIFKLVSKLDGSNYFLFLTSKTSVLCFHKIRTK